MKVTPPPSPPQNESGRSGPAEPARLLDQLKLELGGSTVARVMAKLESAGSQRANLLLELNGQPLKVASETPLNPGQWVRVQRAGNQLRLMEVIDPAAPSPGGGKNAPPELAGLIQALAARLPFQHRLDTGLQQLISLLRSRPETPAPAPRTGELRQLPAGSTAGTSETVRAAVEKLVQSLPRVQTLARLAEQPRPERAVRNLLIRSGHFTEAQLAERVFSDAARALPPADLKLALFEVVRAASPKQEPAQIIDALKILRPAVSQDLVQAPLQFPLAPASHQQQSPAHLEDQGGGQLLKLLVGMLNRISVNQLHAQTITQQSAPDATPAHTWMVEIPWINQQEQPRTVQLRIERRAGDEAAQRRNRKRIIQWRLNLSLDLDDLGPVHFELALQNRQLDTRVWAEKPATVRVLERESERLRERLSQLDLETVKVECRRGQPNQRRTQLEQRLVDIKA